MTDRLFKGFIVSALFIIGCSNMTGNNHQEVLRTIFPKIDLTLDPQKMMDAYSMHVDGQLYRGLFRFNPQGDLVNDLAESWSESADHLRYSVKLKTAKFSDGSPVTSRNVQMTFARMFFIDSSMGADLDYIEGVKKFKKTGKLSDLGVRPVSDHEVEFVLSRPSALFLKHLGVIDSSILPINDFHEQLSSKVFSGPYKLAKQTASSIEIEKWRPDSLDSANPPKRILYSLAKSKPEELGLNGDVDCLDQYRVDKETQTKLLESGWIQTESELVKEFFVILNPKLIPEATRAFLFSRVDTEALLKVIGRPSFAPAYGLIPKYMPGEIQKRSDLDKIVSDKGITGSITLDYSSSDPIELNTAAYLKSIWTTPHFKVILNDMGGDEKLTRMFRKQPEAVIGKKGVDYPDGFSILTYFKSGYEDNYFFVQDPKIDKEIESTVSIMDSKQRIQKYQDIQKLILAHHTVIPIFFGSDASGLWGSMVKSVPAHPMGFHMLPMETVEVRK